MELNCSAPDRAWIDESKTLFDSEGRVIDKDGKPTFPKFKLDDEAEEAGKLIHRIMV